MESSQQQQQKQQPSSSQQQQQKPPSGVESGESREKKAPPKTLELKSVRVEPENKCCDVVSQEKKPSPSVSGEITESHYSVAETGSLASLKRPGKAAVVGSSSSLPLPVSPQREADTPTTKPYVHGLSKPLSPVRAKAFDKTKGPPVDPVLEEEGSDDAGGGQTLRRQQTTRTSLHHFHERRRLSRRSSFHTDMTPTATCQSCPLHHVAPVKTEPVPPPNVPQTRRCSLTLPYPNLYGSWQTAVVPITKSNSNEIPLNTCPPPLLKRRSMVHLDLSRLHTGSSTSAAQPISSEPLITTANAQKPASIAPITPSPVTPSYPADHPLLPCKPQNSPVEVDLIYCSLQKVPMKDFCAEVRASMDVAHFMNQAVLLLDVTENSLERVVELMLHKMLDSEEPHCSVEEAKSVLFTNDSVHLLARTMQGTCNREGGNFDYDQSWICALCNLPTLQRRHVAIARLKHPANFGSTSHEVRLFVLVLCPSKEKGTKNALETGRTFCTILSDMDFRQRLLEAHTEEEFKRLVYKQTQDLAEETCEIDKGIVDNHAVSSSEYEYEEKFCQFGRGIREDTERRIPHYISDYRDGFTGPRTVHKVVSTTLFLYFACILPAIAFGVLNDHNTRGKIDVKKAIIGQTIGGLFYVIFSGQPLLILLTTAPLALYIKIIYNICEDFKLDFHAMYCCVGLWNSFFLILYSLFDVSRLMRWSTRSTEEIFALFISIAFFVDAIRDMVKNFEDNYNTEACKAYSSASSNNLQNMTDLNITCASTGRVDCHRESSVLFILLMLGTLWLGVSLYNFNKTPYLQASKREALADYSLPVAVLVLSFIGSYFFGDIELEHFKYDDKEVFHVAPLHKLTFAAACGAMGLGFSLSLLFFMDQNITSAMVNNPCNKLKKGPAYHLDLFVVAILNGFLSIFCLPWMHATLPHSPLHVRGLADVEERVDQGHVYEIIVKVRETRLTGMLSHILIGLSIFLLPYPMAYIPTAVLDGLFLYMAVTSLNGNQMFERITLLFMEQAAYPPNHYIRRVPQRKIHEFTVCQVAQLVLMCVFGFAPWAYIKMIFPFMILLLLPIRHRLVPLVIEDRYLEALDGEHQ